MPFYSVTFSTLLIFVLGFLALGGVFSKSPLLLLFAFLYAIVMVAAGWIYVFTGRKAAAWIHVILMSGVAICSLCLGFSAIGFNSDAHGPDASPLGAIVVVVGFVSIAVAGGIAFCSVGFIKHVLRENEDSNPSA